MDERKCWEIEEDDVDDEKRRVYGSKDEWKYGRKKKCRDERCWEEREFWYGDR